jgi:hypothetical protein
MDAKVNQAAEPRFEKGIIGPGDSFFPGVRRAGKGSPRAQDSSSRNLDFNKRPQGLKVFDKPTG